MCQHGEVKRILLALLLAISASATFPACQRARPTTDGSAPQPHIIAIGDTRLNVFLDGEFEIGEAAVYAWIESCAAAVATFYGGFPTERLDLYVRSVRGAGVRGGRAWGRGPQIHVSVGRLTEPIHFKNDWVLTHEMVHLAFPDMDSQHQWLEEGLATYVEPLARHQQGTMEAERVWYWLLTGLPKGLPGKTDRGLDVTHTWGRTYWGGALFSFLADLEIRKQTDGDKTLQDALRGVVASGGNMTRHWEVERALGAGDAAIGVDVLVKLYREMATNPHPVDLDAIWKRLGVKLDGRTVLFDDEAPQASLRLAITPPTRSGSGDPPP